MLLTLPRISTAVPAAKIFGGLSERLVRLALAMVQVGMIGKRDVAALALPLCDVTLRELVERAWQKRVGQRCQFVTNSAVLTVHIAPDRPDVPAWEEKTVELILEASPPYILYGGDKLETLERAHPGLGRYVLLAMHRALGLYGEGMTPFGAHEIASYTYWDGEEDETETLEWRTEQGESPDDVPKAAELFDGIPPWAWRRTVNDEPLPTTTRREALRLADTLNDPVLSKLVRDAVRLNSQITRAIKSQMLPDPDENGPSPEFFAVLRWREEDELMRMYDDYYQDAMQVGASYIGAFSFEPTRDGLALALKRIDSTLGILHTLDAMLSVFPKEE